MRSEFEVSPQGVVHLAHQGSAIASALARRIIGVVAGGAVTGTIYGLLSMVPFAKAADSWGEATTTSVASAPS